MTDSFIASQCSYRIIDYMSRKVGEERPTIHSTQNCSIQQLCFRMFSWETNQNEPRFRKGKSLLLTSGCSSSSRNTSGSSFICGTVSCPSFGYIPVHYNVIKIGQAVAEYRHSVFGSLKGVQLFCCRCYSHSYIKLLIFNQNRWDRFRENSTKI
jgi:hypothetical protein